MKLNIQEIRKQSEGLHFEQTLDLAADLRARNQEILDVKDILAVGKVQYEDRMSAQFALSFRHSFRTHRVCDQLDSIIPSYFAWSRSSCVWRTSGH